MKVDDYETLPTNNVLTHMTAGAIAGVMEHCVMYPLDAVKTRMQSLAPSALRLGITDTFLHMIRHEGMLRPVRGIQAMVIGAGPSHALYFSSYEYFKDHFLHWTTSTKQDTIAHGSAGVIATLLHDAIMTPAEVVKQRLQMVDSPYKSAMSCAVRIYQTEGVAAFYRSYTTQLTMNVPFQSIHFMVYEFMQKVTNKDGMYNPKAHVVSGAMAGAFAAAVTTPLDVCKTLLNTQQVGVTSGLLEAIRKVYSIGGSRAYFRGVTARVMFQMPATAICWSTYEFFKYVLGITKLEERCSEPDPPPRCDASPIEKASLKARELPAMAGTGLYNSLAFNTMHTQEPSFNRRKENAILDITHT